MKIQDLLRKDVMLLDLQATEKKAVIEEMIQSLVEHGYVTDFETFKEGILAREALTSTGLGDGIAMPHSKNSAVKEATVLFAKSNKGVDYESLEDIYEKKEYVKSEFDSFVYINTCFKCYGLYKRKLQNCCRK